MQGLPPDVERLRTDLGALLSWEGAARAPAVEILAERSVDGFTEQLVAYPNGEFERVRAFLLIPHGPGPFPGVVVHHQHNGQRHLGKSEVAGHAGDPLQAFGPELARRGIAVLAPDAICFEDRRRNATGAQPASGDEEQHYNEAAYRLVQGSLLMSVVVADAALAVSVLGAVKEVDACRIGTVGHSMGGHTVLFSAGLDERVRWAAISGALGSYRQRISAGTGLELAQVIPGILRLTDFDGLLALLAPRPTLIVSATDDRYGYDAEAIVERADAAWAASGSLEHAQFDGAHALSAERARHIVDWAAATATA